MLTLKSPLVHFILWALGLSQAETQTTDSERNALARHANGRQKVAEIGVWHGVTSCRLLSAMSDTGKFFAIDPYPAGRLGFSVQRIIAQRKLSAFRDRKVMWLRETGVDAANRLRAAGEAVDFLFIDGDHTYEGLRADWEAWKPLISPSGIVACHDSRSNNERELAGVGSVRYTSEVILRDPSFKVIDEVHSLTVLQKLKNPNS
jgi:predicted O-methyltransferase YrrM